MKVSKLEGALLDYWVAQAEGVPADSSLRAMAVAVGSINSYYPAYSTDWAQGGPIIERELIELTYFGGNEWGAGKLDVTVGIGPTPLIAAMRAYVASKFGDTVPDQEQ